MIRDEVDDVAESVDVQGRTERVIVFLDCQAQGSEPVIADVIAMAAAGVCLEMGRAVAIGHSQLREI